MLTGLLLTTITNYRYPFGSINLNGINFIWFMKKAIYYVSRLLKNCYDNKVPAVFLSKNKGSELIKHGVNRLGGETTNNCDTTRCETPWRETPCWGNDMGRKWLGKKRPGELSRFSTLLRVSLITQGHPRHPIFFFYLLLRQSVSDHYLRSCGYVTCSRPRRTATRLRLEPGTSPPKVLGFTTAPVRSTHHMFIYLSILPYALVNILGRCAQRLLVSDS